MKPPESFVPLTPTAPAPAAQEYRVTLLPAKDAPPGAGIERMAGHGHGTVMAADRCTGFQSLTSKSAATLSQVNGAETKIGEPRVSIQREGDRVTHLRIQCACGQVLDLACVYDAPPMAK